MLNVDPQKPESTALRAFAVLEYVAHANKPVSLDDVTHACKLPKPTVFRILSMLFEADLVYREPLGKRYTVGARSTSCAIPPCARNLTQSCRNSWTQWAKPAT